MDQEQQPTVWPPAPTGTGATPLPNAFRSAPVKWVIGLTTASIPLTVMTTICDLGQAGLASAILDRVNTVLSPVSSIVQLAAYVAFLVWFYRVYKNLTTFETSGLRYTAGWAVGWFFVPIFSIFRPYQMGQVIWKASSPGIDSSDSVAWKRAPSGGLVIAWWSLSLFSSAITFPLALGDYLSKSKGVGFFMESALSAVVSIAVDASTILLILAVSARQRAKAVSLFGPSQLVD